MCNIPYGFLSPIARGKSRDLHRAYPHRDDSFAPCEALGPPQPESQHGRLMNGDVSILNKAENLYEYIYIYIYTCMYTRYNCINIYICI